MQPSVDSFGIRLNPELAAIPDRLSAVPAGEIILPEIGGPAFLWNVTFMGQRVFTLTVNTVGLAANIDSQSPIGLADVCAQGIVVADDQGNPFWEQPESDSSCV